jgi:hypothetical protein
MFVSKRLLILPLGLLVTLPGCSGSRLQHIFAPDRDFMTLSELDEDEGLERGPDSSMASGEADETSENEGRGLFDVVGWLRPKSKNNDALPSDPFREDNYDAEADKRQPIATVGLSKNLGEKAEQLISDHNNATQPTTTPKIAATVEKTVKRSSQAPTFADIMSEFEESVEDLSTEPDSVDAMEEAWLENQSSDSQRVSHSDTLMAEATDDGSTESQSMNLAETTQESEKIDELIQGLEASETFDPFGDSSLELPNTADLFDSETTDDESLWQSSDSDIGWKAPGSGDSANLQESPFLSDHSTMGNWDFGPVTEGRHSSSQLPPIAQSSSAASNPGQQPAMGQSFTNSYSQPVAIARSQSQTLSDDPFLNDFVTQAAAPARATDSNIPAASSVGTIQNVSARTWLMLLGAVVIAYLLFAPGQKKLRHQNNR